MTTPGALRSRFVLTRLWFTVSLGAPRPDDPFSWLRACVSDVQEIVNGEIWAVTVRCASHRETFYVLEATCEVIGRPQAPAHPSSTTPLAISPCEDIPVRADWSQYIAYRLPPAGAHTGPHRPLVSHLKWADHGEYERGISAHWLRRMATRGKEGAALRAVAERYVLACVAGNGVSGTWMSATEMAQECAGLPQRTLCGKKRPPQMNMFLPT